VKSKVPGFPGFVRRRRQRIRQRHSGNAGIQQRQFAPDLPGQGDSDKPASGYDTTSLAHSVQGLLQQLGVPAHCRR
jgi:pimeloyl-ACP methyl ester carboxylesterase